jgi:IS5 family transposase
MGEGAVVKEPRQHCERACRQHLVDKWLLAFESLCRAATGQWIADSKMLPELLHGDERKVWGDAACQGQGEKMRAKAPRAQDMTSRRARYKQVVNQLQRQKNRTKAQVRSRVEHVFRVMKRQFGFDRVRYKGLAKNANRMFTCFALVNLYLTRKRLAPLGA